MQNVPLPWLIPRIYLSQRVQQEHGEKNLQILPSLHFGLGNSVRSSNVLVTTPRRYMHPPKSTTAQKSTRSPVKTWPRHRGVAESVWCCVLKRSSNRKVPRKPGWFANIQGWCWVDASKSGGVWGGLSNGDFFNGRFTGGDFPTRMIVSKGTFPARMMFSRNNRDVSILKQQEWTSVLGYSDTEAIGHK